MQLIDVQLKISDFNFYIESNVWEIQIVKDPLVSLVLYHHQVVISLIL